MLLGEENLRHPLLVGFFILGVEQAKYYSLQPTTGIPLCFLLQPPPNFREGNLCRFRFRIPINPRTQTAKSYTAAPLGSQV